MSVKYCLPVPVFYFWRELLRTLQRGLSAIAEHLVDVVLSQIYWECIRVPINIKWFDKVIIFFNTHGSFTRSGTKYA